MGKKQTRERAITNTAEEAKNAPQNVLAHMVVMGAGAAIEAQEAEGQREVVATATLPTRLGDCSDRPKVQAALEAAGVKFLGPVEGDPLFQRVTLPAGWKKIATDHSLYTNLVDEQGRVRASIFYKAAFYDRDAFLRLVCRYTVTSEYTPMPVRPRPERKPRPPSTDRLSFDDFYDRYGFLAPHVRRAREDAWREDAAERVEREENARIDALEEEDRRNRKVRFVVKDAGKTDGVLFATEWIAYGDWKLGETKEKEARDWLEEQFPESDDPSAYWGT